MVACLNRSVTVKARPSTVDDLTLASPATTDGAATAICTSDGGKLAGTCVVQCLSNDGSFRWERNMLQRRRSEGKWRLGAPYRPC